MLNAVSIGAYTKVELRCVMFAIVVLSVSSTPAITFSGSKMVRIPRKIKNDAAIPRKNDADPVASLRGIPIAVKIIPKNARKTDSIISIFYLKKRVAGSHQWQARPRIFSPLLAAKVARYEGQTKYT